MQKSRWWRPSLAFLITFGLTAIGGNIVRTIVVSQHYISAGIRPGDPDTTTEMSRELARLDHLYTPTFLLVAIGVSLLMAGVFAWWRPKPKIHLPPPLPAERDVESR